MRVAILLNRDRPRLARSGKQVLTRRLRARARPDAAAEALPEFDGFAALLDRRSARARDGEPDRLGRARALRSCCSGSGAGPTCRRRACARSAGAAICRRCCSRGRSTASGASSIPRDLADALRALARDRRDRRHAARHARASYAALAPARRTSSTCRVPVDVARFAALARRRRRARRPRRCSAAPTASAVPASQLPITTHLAFRRLAAERPSLDGALLRLRRGRADRDAATIAARARPRRAGARSARTCDRSAAGQTSWTRLPARARAAARRDPGPHRRSWRRASACRMVASEEIETHRTLYPADERPLARPPTAAVAARAACSTTPTSRPTVQRARRRARHVDVLRDAAGARIGSKTRSRSCATAEPPPGGSMKIRVHGPARRGRHVRAPARARSSASATRRSPSTRSPFVRAPRAARAPRAVAASARARWFASTTPLLEGASTERRTSCGWTRVSSSLPDVLEAARAASGVRFGSSTTRPTTTCCSQNSVAPPAGGASAQYDVVVTTEALERGPASDDGRAPRRSVGATPYDPGAPPAGRRARDAERAALGCDVSFIGRWEPDRERLLDAIAALPIRSRVRGPGWETRALAPADARVRGGRDLRRRPT